MVSTRTKRFEPFIAGMEIGNAFSELNDPDDQRGRFLDQAEAASRGDLEAEPLDEDFLRALEHGIAPATRDLLAKALLEGRPFSPASLFEQKVTPLGPDVVIEGYVHRPD